MLNIRDMQIKGTMHCHYMPIRTVKIKTTNNTKGWPVWGALVPSYVIGRNADWYNPF